ncbi:hypothetical protein COCSUDRAFT_68326 [Coccomyxa subellipsoidea C-169]|uniref:DRBM domain-containing protein n=1 Tax=Coccomyxa subellipsoidea (strain C-169) TaxID=574566 RepID=I0YJ31_COCSC|nr:hypothetical protein COCSUDRAFT_68326 [Coccomyxa subellipsoidea C-169]EIE18400.1 hypothetical protein COCSUDRAFT_68326 [Coccomyxa subellipsoidea C-169]|eukprot:XP_005642944.1 hypothetical protein COCSUDRAFT_68326 [Coccomyxa subellipsoidea C-169]
MAETTFTAWSRSKKSAEHAAAEKALAILVSKGVLKASPPPNGADVTARPGKAIDFTMREVNFTPDRLRTLCSAASFGNKSVVISDTSGEETDLPAVNVDALSKEALLLELKKAQQMNQQLKAELSLEQQRRMAVLTALIQAN